MTVEFERFCLGVGFTDSRSLEQLAKRLSLVLGVRLDWTDRYDEIPAFELTHQEIRYTLWGEADDEPADDPWDYLLTIRVDHPESVQTLPPLLKRILPSPLPAQLDENHYSSLLTAELQELGFDVQAQLSE